MATFLATGDAQITDTVCPPGSLATDSLSGTGTSLFHPLARYTDEYAQAVRDFLEKDGPVPIGYTLASRNLFTLQNLGPASLAIQKYTPVFLHDVLMLPGSVSNVLEKQSQAAIIPRMTAAYLPGHRKVVGPGDGLAYLLPVAHAYARTSGMLLLGQGTRQRTLIEEHYGQNVKAITVEVVINIRLQSTQYTAIPVVQAVRIKAVAYLATAQQIATWPSARLREWKMHKFLTGKYLI